MIDFVPEGVKQKAMAINTYAFKTGYLSVGFYLFFQKNVIKLLKISLKVKYMSRFIDIELLTESIKTDLYELFSSDFSGHDLLHTVRVLNNAQKIHCFSGGDIYLITLGALLHDADDKKLFPENKENEHARRIMENYDVSSDDIDIVIDIINRVSFSSGKTAEALEAKIVQDADRLDALGAVGIARCFSYGAAHGRPIYNESDFVDNNMEVSNSGIAHFYQKLLKLKSMMNTEYAKNEAEKRTVFLENYLNQFISEIKNDK